MGLRSDKDKIGQIAQLVVSSYPNDRLYLCPNVSKKCFTCIAWVPILLTVMIAFSKVCQL